MFPERLNYLHRGDVTANVSHLNKLPLTGVHLRSVIKSLVPMNAFAEVVDGYDNPRKRYIDVAQFRRDWQITAQARLSFERIGCRGFSYSLWSGVDFGGDELRNDINIRLALLPENELFYPRHIRRYLRRGESNHVRGAGFQSIAFALARLQNRQCDVLVMQSDLARRRPAYIRDHFRGWRRLLFLMICRHVIGSADTIRLFGAADVARAVHPHFPARTQQVNVWTSIYDRTAVDLGLNLTSTPMIDISLYAGYAPVTTNRAFISSPQRVIRRLELDDE